MTTMKLVLERQQFALLLGQQFDLVQIEDTGKECVQFGHLVHVLFTLEMLDLEQEFSSYRKSAQFYLFTTKSLPIGQVYMLMKMERRTLTYIEEGRYF
jgi:hypothetical protein